VGHLRAVPAATQSHTLPEETFTILSGVALSGRRCHPVVGRKV